MLKHGVKNSIFLKKQQRMKDEHSKALEEIRSYRNQHQPIASTEVAQLKEQAHAEEFKLADVQVYEERQRSYKIISNRMKILAQKHPDFPNMRLYKHDQISKYEDFFNPMRVKLRVMSQEQAGLVVPG